MANSNIRNTTFLLIYGHRDAEKNSTNVLRGETSNSEERVE